MSQHQVQPRLMASNGVGRRRTDRDTGSHGITRTDAGFRSDSQSWRGSSHGPSRVVPNSNASPGSVHGSGHQFSSVTSNNNNTATGANRSSTDRADVGPTIAGRSGVGDRALYERLVFMATCLVGRQVEVQVKNGSFYTGIFHTANVEKDFGVVLKMARLTKDGSVQGGKSEAVKEAARRAPQKTFIIHAKDFVQIIAKEVALSGDALPNGRARENRAEIVTDAGLSQVRQPDVQRELKPWKPDDEAPRALGLETTFQNSWNRSWDQFETNKTLFGVESTFNEELYTTKLERGPRMREREREASRIAREIEGTATKNVHLAEERGISLAPELEVMDEESRFSSVIRGRDKLDVGEDGEDGQVDDHNEETFGSSSTGGPVDSASPCGSSVSAPLAGDCESKKSRPSTADSNHAGVSPYHSPVGRDSPLISPPMGDAASIQALNLDPSRPQVPEEVYREFHEFKRQETAKKGKKQREEQVNELKSFSESLKKKELEPRSPKGPSKVSGVEQVPSSRHIPHEGRSRPAASADAKSTVASSVPAVLPDGAQVSVPPQSTSMIPVGLSRRLSGGSLVDSAHILEAVAADPIAGSSLEITNRSDPAASVASVVTTSVSVQSGGVLSPTVLRTVSPPSVSFDAPSSILVPIHSASDPTSPLLSPLSSVSSEASGVPFGSKKSTLNPNAKEFKLNPNAKAFTPNFNPLLPLSPMIQGQIYMHTGLPPGAQMQGLPIGMNVGTYVQQAGHPTQFTQYNNTMVAASSSMASSPQFMHSPGGYISNSGIPPVLAGQPGMKMQSHSQQVVGSHYGQQQHLRYPAQGHPMQPQPAYIHPNHLYPQQVMYGQQQVLYMQQFPHGIVQGQPLPLPQQGQLPPQPSQQGQHKNRSALQQVHYPSFVPGQPHLQPQLSHLHNSLQTAPVSMPGLQQGILPPTPSGGGLGGAVGGLRVGVKGGVGGLSQL